MFQYSYWEKAIGFLKLPFSSAFVFFCFLFAFHLLKLHYWLQQIGRQYILFVEHFFHDVLFLSLQTIFTLIAICLINYV